MINCTVNTRCTGSSHKVKDCRRFRLDENWQDVTETSLYVMMVRRLYENVLF